MAKRPRNIAVVTGSRAEFGLLAPVMRAIERQRGLELRVLVAGAHLSSGSWRDVPRAGFEIAARVPMQRRGRTGRAADAAALGHGIVGFGRAFVAIAPLAVVVLGDRIEAFAAAAAAQVSGLYLAHIHGGDRAEGVADEALRHAISKMAHLHFCATAQSRARLIRMGENEAFVRNVGSPAIDGLRDIKPMSDKPLAQLGISPDRPFVVVLKHPTGAADAVERRWMAANLEVVEKIAREKKLGLVIMSPNGDPGCEGIRAAIDAFRGRKTITPNTIFISHLSRHQYVAMLMRAAALVGNSSGGLIEAAAIRTVGGLGRDGSKVVFRTIAGLPVVNIGDRQSGRQRPANVLDCREDKAALADALRRALLSRRSRLRHPYGDGRAGERIAALLAETNWSRVPLHKHNRY